jgi:hypothetical protein
MSVLGAGFSFFIVLLIGLPLSLFAIFVAPTSVLLVFLDGVAQRLLSGFLLVYVYAVVSGLVFTSLANLASALLPAGLGRRILIWLLCSVYLTATAFYLLFAMPAMHAIYFAAAALVPGSLSAGSLSVAWLLLSFAAPVHFLIVLIGYIVADANAPTGNVALSSPGELLWRGVLIGFNAGMNLLLTMLALGALLEPFLGTAGVYVGVAAGIIAANVTSLAAVMPTPSAGANTAIRLFVGWMSWLLPMSWVVVMLGWLLQLSSVLFHFLLGLPFHPFSGLFAINAASVRIQEGTLFLEGGIGSNLWIQGPIVSRGAYNLGTFGFVHGLTVLTPPGLIGIPGIGLAAGSAITVPLLQHESGHNLNLTAFGLYFHLINLVDENIFPARLADAYAERLAESNVPGTTAPVLPLWN